MREFRTDSAALIDPGRHILGGVLLSELFPVIISRNELSGRVSTHMSKQITTADPADTLQQVYAKIVETGLPGFALACIRPAGSNSTSSWSPGLTPT